MIKDLDERIICENESVLVVNKPYGLPSTGKSLDDDDCLQFYLIKRHGGMVWAIHQLDADTSGVNIFVTDKKLVPIYKKYLEDPAKVNSLINVLFTNATTDSLLSNGTIDITYNYKLQLITRANANTTLDEGATKIAADKMQELIFIITQIFTYHANMNPPLQLNNIHNLALSSYEVGALDESNTIDKYIGCMFDLKITAREYPLLSNINILQGFNIELDYNNKIIKLITDT